jgi:hypothetical protein
MYRAPAWGLSKVNSVLSTISRIVNRALGGDNRHGGRETVGSLACCA